MPRITLGLFLLFAGCMSVPYDSGAEVSSTVQALATAGPLKVSATNPRYFADRTGAAVYLTGSHNWNSLQDSGLVGQPATIFDYDGYLAFMTSHHHNFMRMWSYEAWESGSTQAGYYSPVPYKLVSGTYDQNPVYDLNQFDQSYFDRLRARVMAAQSNGIYVSVMLFQGWSIESKGNPGNPWVGHPFNAKNNINGINGDLDGDGQGTETHTLANAAVTALQDLFIQKVVDTVNDLDNVLYEVSNEDTASTENTQWQSHVINTLKSYEATKPFQHPVGMTAPWPLSTNADMYDSPADWVSPITTSSEPYSTSPPPATGVKVIVLDTDHLSPRPADRTWIWKSLTRGVNPIYMDELNTDATRETFRVAMGDSSTYAQKMNLVGMTPQGNLSSTGYALARSGSEYLFYQPGSGAFTGTLAAGTYSFEWFNPTTSSIASIGTVGGGTRAFTPPFSGDAVLYLKNTGAPVITISNVATSSITATSATITWTTNVAGDSRVSYGTRSTSLNKSAYAAAPVTSHSIKLSLNRKTTYYYSVSSTDAAGNTATSAIYSFTTARQ